MTVALGQLGVRGVVLDIEGTTTPISFVYDVLFPYARTHLRSFLETHGPSGLLAEVDAQLREEHAADVARGDSPPPLPADMSRGNAVDLEPYVRWLMDRDRKSTGLKLLQGMIWQRGFADGTLRGELFPDVAPALERFAAGPTAWMRSPSTRTAQPSCMASPSKTRAGLNTVTLSARFAGPCAKTTP